MQTDRAAWRVGKVFLTHKFMRKALLAYLVLLHVVIVYMLAHR